MNFRVKPNTTNNIFSSVTANQIIAGDIDIDDVGASADRFNVALSSSEAITNASLTKFTNWGTPTSEPAWCSWDADNSELTINENGYFLVSVSMNLTNTTSTGISTYISEVVAGDKIISYTALSSAPYVVKNSTLLVFGATAKVILQAIGIGGTATVDSASFTVRKIIGTGSS